MSGPEGSSIKHCIVCAVGIFCPEHSTLYGKNSVGFVPALLFLSLIFQVSLVSAVSVL